MKKHIVRSLLASVALTAMIFGAAAQPAKADQAATTRLIVGVAAAAAIATAINVQHKHQAANTVVGYLPDGSPVYQDGHVVSSQGGQSWYPGNYGQQIACNQNQCYVSGSNNGYGYSNNGYNGYGVNNNNGYGYDATGYQSHRRHRG